MFVDLLDLYRTNDDDYNPHSDSESNAKINEQSQWDLKDDSKKNVKDVKSP